MHGKTKVDGTSSNFSVSMQNGYSISPNYAQRYILKHNLVLIESNVFSQIIDRIYKKSVEYTSEYKNKVFQKDALKSSKFIKEKPDLIFTSPPYLNIVKYVSQNWIRFWLLGWNKDETKGKIVDDFHNVPSYKIFLKEFLLDMEKIMKPNTKLILVIGDVKTFKINDLIKEILPQTNLFLETDPVSQILRRKQSSQMGNKIGKATKEDWIFELKLR